MPWPGGSVPRAGRTIGYARVSTAEQSPALLVDALERAGCERVWVEQGGGASPA
jgi:DNA invertase Pin-like site-specific DNA recombinase